MTKTDIYRIGFQLMGIYLLIDGVANAAQVIAAFDDSMLKYAFGLLMPTFVRTAFGVILLFASSWIAKLCVRNREPDAQP